MSPAEKTHDCGYVFPRVISVSTEPESALPPIAHVILHVQCPRCEAHCDLTVILRQDVVREGKGRLDS